MTILGKIYPIKWMFLLVWCALALVGCQAEGEYSTWPCRFGYDNAIQKPKTEQERLANQVLGLNNGIIVGFQTLNQSPNGGFVAYDVQCPNCVRRENNTLNPKFAVALSNTGIATCGKCGKKYDLNNGGIVQNGEQGDVGLAKYLATTTGPFGYLSAGTKR